MSETLFCEKHERRGAKIYDVILTWADGTRRTIQVKKESPQCPECIGDHLADMHKRNSYDWPDHVAIEVATSMTGWVEGRRDGDSLQ